VALHHSKQHIPLYIAPSSWAGSVVPHLPEDGAPLLPNLAASSAEQVHRTPSSLRLQMLSLDSPTQINPPAQVRSDAVPPSTPSPTKRRREEETNVDLEESPSKRRTLAQNLL